MVIKQFGCHRCGQTWLLMTDNEESRVSQEEEITIRTKARMHTSLCLQTGGTTGGHYIKGKIQEGD